MLCDELSLSFNNVTLQLLCDEWASVFTLQLLCDEWAVVLKLFLSLRQCSHFNCYAMSGLNCNKGKLEPNEYSVSCLLALVSER